VIEQVGDDEDLDQIQLLHLGLAYEQRGDSVHAIRLLGRALEVGGRSEPLIRSLLDELRGSHPAAAEEARLPK
jgi:hypothetical protein